MKMKPTLHLTQLSLTFSPQHLLVLLEKTLKGKNKIALIKLELVKYLTEPLWARGKDPMLWWRQHSEQYPKLTTLVLKYLSAPPNSVNSERLFNAAGRIYTENRNRLPRNADRFIQNEKRQTWKTPQIECLTALTMALYLLLF